MAAIWSTDPSGTWRLLPKSGFPDEATLHTLVEQAPQLMPLAGSPRLAVVGREVRLGSGSADLVAVEPSGRMVVIEVKLAANSEARRAVVAQVLAYAANLQGLTPSQLESDVLGSHLQARGYDSLFAASLAASQDQPSDSARQRFERKLAESLAGGSFRLVIVLDDAPADLVRLVGYLEYVTERLVIDLVTVAAYQVGETEIVVPTRVDPEHVRAERAVGADSSSNGGSESPGIEGFRTAMAEAPPEQRAVIEGAVRWAARLEQRGLAAPLSYQGPAGAILRMYIPGDMSLATVNSVPELRLFSSFGRSSTVAPQRPRLGSRRSSGRRSGREPP